MNRSITPKHQRHINQVQSTDATISDHPGIDNTETSELQLSHLHDESTDDENDTENIHIVTILKIELKHEKPIDSNHYQKDFVSSNYQDQGNNQQTTNDPPHKIETNSRTNKNTRKQKMDYHHQKKKFRHSTFFRQPKKEKLSTTRP